VHSQEYTANITTSSEVGDKVLPQITVKWYIWLLALSAPESMNIKKREVVMMRGLIFKKGVYVGRRFWTVVLCLLLALSLVLTMGCQKKPGEEQNKAIEKVAEVKEKAVETAIEVKDKAVEKTTEIKDKAVEKAGEVKAKAVEKTSEVKAKATEMASEVKAKVAGWDSCKGCHRDGDKPASSKATLLKKFKTADDFIKAAKESNNPMMNNFKKDDQLKAATKDLGLK